MLQKISFVFIFIIMSNWCMSQTTITTNNNLNPSPTYFGGGIVLGGGAGSFQIGLNPELIKSYNEYIDLGLAMNLYYSSYRSTNLLSGNNYKSTNTQFGLGTFVRAWPLQQFFVQIQPEYNWTFTNAKNYTTGTSGSSSVNAPSILAGIGYGNRNQNGFSYFSIMFDLVNSPQSPYRMGQLSAQPIFRAGFGIPIHLSSSKHP